MRNKLISFCLVAWILAALPLSAAAQEFDPGRTGSISVTLVASQPMAGGELSVYTVASVRLDDAGNLLYVAEDIFEKGGISLEDPELAQKLDTFVAEQAVPARKMVTDAQGHATCSELPLGLYFVKQTGAAEGFAPCSPFLVSIPMETDEGLLYDVDATPKTDVERLISVTIKKVWNTDESTEIPSGVTVQLLHQDAVLETATLNANNDWQVTYPNLPESDGYSIKEVNIPAGFTATYSKNGYVFTVTNTATLAQTGQLIWPVPLLAVAGLGFLVIGFALLRKSEKHHG